MYDIYQYAIVVASSEISASEGVPLISVGLCTLTMFIFS